MDEKITDVLTILDREDSPSQREIAKQTGFSVGLVNTLIKKCAKKGLVKIERLNSRNIKYILTPEGIKEKTQKTIDYIKRSYQAIQQLQNRVTELALKHSSEGKEIYIYKEDDDEIFQLVINTLNSLNIEYKVINKKNLNKIVNENSIIYHWNSTLMNSENELINILNKN
ncbi:Winged helix-turn-helix DNA-binding [Halanaerobium congolense]|uniref:Winged helix-turn-helix DNA-binding n=1 Tax=Halanaerobium congolense TaxID=54121 RepID=A0A1G8R3K2_9FIRM|nr:winged helix-turn-helix transcriptional regulator [Halanaerobium congolense]SDJ11564.1 Winged helix-turn-helix DNA-binding [Halanaerobium congolense]SET66212.1 Winged helix-turn-helix DNA-binding [Halanaerobium congolense]